MTATYCTVFRFDGVLIDAAAHHGMSAESLEELRRVYPMPLATADTLAARMLDSGRCRSRMWQTS